MHETSTLIPMQFHIINICSVRIGVLYRASSEMYLRGHMSLLTHILEDILGNVRVNSLNFTENIAILRDINVSLI